MAALREYARMKALVKEEAGTCGPDGREKALQIIAGARADKRDSLTEIEAKEVFSAYGLPVTRTVLAKSEDEAVKMAYEVGYPVVMKIVSPDILHKSDAGGVKVNIRDENGVREAYRTIMKNAKAYKETANIHGIAIQEMAPWGTEVILGSVNDPTFGPTMMFGLGGIFVEVMKDVTFHLAPITADEAMQMLKGTRSYALLQGARGQAPVDLDAIAGALQRISQLATDYPEIKELDINPLIVGPVGMQPYVADARMTLSTVPQAHE
jgi:acetyltransferase